MEGKRSVNLTGAGTRGSVAGSCCEPAAPLRRASSCSVGRHLPRAAPPWVRSTRSASASPPATHAGRVRPLDAAAPGGPPLDGSVMKQEPYGVRYEVAADPEFRTIVRRGSEEAVWAESHTVHAEIAGLPRTAGTGTASSGGGRSARSAGHAPRRRSARRSTSSGSRSRRARTTPAATTARTRTWPSEDVELVVHLGDYIYEGAASAPTRASARTSPGGAASRSPTTAPAMRSTSPT